MQLGPSCVSVTVYMCAYMYVYVFVWVFLARCCHSEHSTLYTKDSSSKEKRGRKRKRENRVESAETRKTDALVLYRVTGAGSRLTLTADVSPLGDEGWGERDSNEQLRHHSLLPGLFKGHSSGVRSSGWEGQRRKKGEEDDRGGELMGLTGLETAKTFLQREKTRNGVGG